MTPEDHSEINCPHIETIIANNERLANIEGSLKRIEGNLNNYMSKTTALELARAEQNGIEKQKTKQGSNWVAILALIISAIAAISSFASFFERI